MTAKQLVELMDNQTFMDFMGPILYNSLKQNMMDPRSPWFAEFTESVDNISPEEFMKALSSSARAKKRDNSKHGYEGWKDILETGYDMDASDSHYLRNKVVLPAVGDAAKLVGDVVGAKQSILGSALQAMAQRRASEAGMSPVANISANLLNAAGAGKQFQGLAATTVGNVLGNRIAKTGEILEAPAEQARNMAMQINDRPAGEFWSNATANKKLSQKS